MKKLIPTFLVAALLLFPAQFISLGQVDVATAGTPVQITSAAAHTAVNSVIIRALDTNSGKVYIGLSTMNNSTLADVIYFLVPGDAWSVGTTGMNEINATELYIDCESGNTDSVVASVLVR